MWVTFLDTGALLQRDRRLPLGHAILFASGRPGRPGEKGYSGCLMVVLLGWGPWGTSDMANGWSTNDPENGPKGFSYVFYRGRLWWIAWMFLSGGLLAASLMIFRTVGYRLVRSGATSRRSVAARS